MSDDLTVMGIERHGRRQRWGESRLFSRIRRSTRLRATRMSRQSPKASPDLVTVALGPDPGRCLQVGFDQQRLVRDRGLRSPTLCRRLAPRAGRRSWRRTRAGHRPQAAQTPPPAPYPDPCRARWRHTHRRDLTADPNGPKVSVLASSSSTCMVNSPIRFMALSSSACTGSPLRYLERGVDPADRFLTPLLEPEHLYAQLARQPYSCTGSSRKSLRTTSRLARHGVLRPSTSQRACRQSVDEP